MQTSMTWSPLSRLSASQKIGLGSALAVVGASIVVLSPLLGWTEIARPWSFLLGFTGGAAAGTGAPLAICGLVGMRRQT